MSSESQPDPSRPAREDRFKISQPHCVYGRHYDWGASGGARRRNPVGAMEIIERAKPLHWRLKVAFWFDVTLAVSVCAPQTVPATGLVIHEWLGLALVTMVYARLLLSRSWIASNTRRYSMFDSGGDRQRRKKSSKWR